MKQGPGPNEVRAQHAECRSLHLRSLNGLFDRLYFRPVPTDLCRRLSHHMTINLSTQLESNLPWQLHFIIRCQIIEQSSVWFPGPQQASCLLNGKGGPSGKMMNNCMPLICRQISASSAWWFENCCWSARFVLANREQPRHTFIFPLRASYRPWQRVMTVKWKDDALEGALFPRGCKWNVCSCMPKKHKTTTTTRTH